MWRKLWHMFFPARPEQLLDTQLVEGMQQLQISVNTRAYEEYVPNVRLDLKGVTYLSAAMGMRGKEGRWDIWQNGEWSSGRFARASQKMFAPLWLFTHVCLRESFTPYKEKSLTPVPGQTTAGLQKESQGLQWLQTSFRVLNAALESCKGSKDRTVVANFQMNPESFSIQCFNLDIAVVFRSEGHMSVVVFDDKNQGTGSAEKPSLEADFATLKPAVLDEFIKLSALILQSTEARYR